MLCYEGSVLLYIKLGSSEDFKDLVLNFCLGEKITLESYISYIVSLTAPPPHLAPIIPNKNCSPLPML